MANAASAEPALSFPPELLLAARGEHSSGIGAAIFDVDGVLTDGRIYIGESGEVFKSFSTLDGQGMKLLARAGIEKYELRWRWAFRWQLVIFS